MFAYGCNRATGFTVKRVSLVRTRAYSVFGAREGEGGTARRRTDEVYAAESDFLFLFLIVDGLSKSDG